MQVFEKLSVLLFDVKADDQVRDVAGSGIKALISDYPADKLVVLKKILTTLVNKFVDALGVCHHAHSLTNA